MKDFNKRAVLCFTLFGIALGAAILSFAGAVLLAYSKAYAAAVVLAVVAVICFYAAPIYYNNAATSKAYAKITLALDEGVETLEALSESTGIRLDTAKKLLAKARNRGIIINFDIPEKTNHE